jgi:hypothetical protein
MPARLALFRDEASGIVFHFAYERGSDRLHITARHGTTPQDAVRTFFDPHANSTWDATHQRWERWADDWLVSFLWLDAPANRNVLVITCLRA